MWRRGSALRDSTWMRFLPFSLTNIQRFDLGRRRWWFTASMKDISTITGLEKMSQTQLIRSGRITSYLVSDTSNCLSPFKGCQMTDPKSTRITNGSLFCWMSGIKEITCVTSVNTAVEFCHELLHCAAVSQAGARETAPMKGLHVDSPSRKLSLTRHPWGAGEFLGGSSEFRDRGERVERWRETVGGFQAAIYRQQSRVVKSCFEALCLFWGPDGDVSIQLIASMCLTTATQNG